MQWINALHSASSQREPWSEEAVIVAGCLSVGVDREV